jgi:hypothetical protein
MNLIYSGIGCKNPPSFIIGIISEISIHLANKHYLLRSGASIGCQSAFESGCKSINGYRDIYLPWRSYNDNDSMLYDISEESKIMAKSFYPKYDDLSLENRLIFARNCNIILGDKLDTPSDFIICYTEEGKHTGETGHALKIAKKYNIPIFNFGNKDLTKEIFYSRLELLLMSTT